VVSLTTQRALHAGLSLSKPSGVVTLTWAVTETGSGIAGHDVDVSVGGSAFTCWRSTTETSAVYTGQRGVIYAFRVTAVDRARALISLGRSFLPSRPVLNRLSQMRWSNLFAPR
jgi:hypothetical protein